MADRNDFLTPASKARIEARNESEAYRLSREQADKQGKILNPDEVAGDYDFSKLMVTTLHGETRPITVDDLKQFAYNARVLGKKYKGGITCKQIIDHSLFADRDRANKQIRTAIPVSAKSGVIHFQTNAGPDSDKTRHHVYVELLDYPAAVASGAHSKDIAKVLLKGKVKVECDCGRWRYWFRYIATIGHYNLINRETGYPKIRNPKLSGVACKHILRVCQIIQQSPGFRGYVEKMIDRSRAGVAEKSKANSVKEMERLSKTMQKEYGKKKITTTEERRLKREQTPAFKRALKERQKQEKSIAKVKKKSSTKAATKVAKAGNKEAEIKRQLQLAEHNMRNAGLPDSVVKASLKAAERELRKAAK